MTNAFRSYLDSKNFTEIQSSKFQEVGAESGSAVFKVDYFGRVVTLAQSPQIFKQMCVAADMDRVYEIGPVFRAENSNTHRHLTEFTGLDLEMAFDSNYHEVMLLIDGMLKHIFKTIQTNYRDEVRRCLNVLKFNVFIT
jgi:ergosteryl-3beta-O-L-aspartate synthase